MSESINEVRAESREVLQELRHLGRTLSHVPTTLVEINRKLEAGQALLATKAELQDLKGFVSSVEAELVKLEDRVRKTELEAASAMAEAKGKSFWQDKMFGWVMAVVFAAAAAYFKLKE